MQNSKEMTPCSRVLLERLTVTQLVKKLPAFYGNRRFITVFTTDRHWSLSSPHLPNPFPFLRFTDRNLVHISCFSMRATCHVHITLHYLPVPVFSMTQTYHFLSVLSTVNW